MPTVATIQSVESAYEQALHDYLVDSLGFKFGYLALETIPDDSPVGWVGITGIVSRVVGNMRQNTVTCTIRIVLAHVGIMEGKRQLNDWGATLTDAIRELSVQGMTGNYRGRDLTGALRGICPIDEMKFVSASVAQRQDLETNIFNGLLSCNYRFTIEQKIFDEFW